MKTIIKIFGVLFLLMLLTTSVPPPPLSSFSQSKVDTTKVEKYQTKGKSLDYQQIQKQMDYQLNKMDFLIIKIDSTKKK